MNRHQRRVQAARQRRTRTGYVHRLIAARVGGAVPRVGLFHSLIEHDADCGIWSGQGCDCVPNVSISLPCDNAVVLVDRDGNTKKVARS
jgi:hypothetical protein